MAPSYVASVSRDAPATQPVISVADGPLPTITATPGKIVLAPGQSVEAWLLITADPEAAIDSLELSSTTATGVLIALSTPPERLAAGESTIVIATLSAPAEGLSTGDVAISLRYVVRPSPPSGSGAAADAFAGFAVATIGLEKNAGAGKVEIKSAAGPVTSVRPGIVQVSVTNAFTSAASIFVIPRDNAALTIQPPRYVGTAVPPGDTIAVEFTITASDQINPGETLVVFDVATVSAAGTHHTVASVAPQLAVFGVAEFSGPLGIPTFYLAPGLIILATWGLLQSLFGRVHRAILGGPDAKEFWIVGVALSLATAFFLYPAFTTVLASLFGWFGGSGRDYLRGFGTVDVAALWSLALLIPVLVYAPIRGAQAIAQRNVPKAGDSPWKLIERLAGADLTVGRPHVTAGQRSGLLLERTRSGKASYWIGPQIGIRWGRPKNEGAELEQQIDSHLQNDKSIKALWLLLQKARANNYIELHWVSGAMDGPELVPASEANYGPPRRIATKDPERGDT